MCIVHASQMQRRLARLCVNFEGGRRECGMGCRIGAGAACLRAARIIFAAQGLRNTAGLGGGAGLLNLSQESVIFGAVFSPETYGDLL